MLRYGKARRAEGYGAWPCGDYCALNASNIPGRYPVPHIQDYARYLSGCTIFSKIDLVRAYHQIPVHTDDIQKRAITTAFGLFEFPFMSFGLRNAAHFPTFLGQHPEILKFLLCLR
jgi:hypothetical protein